MLRHTTITVSIVLLSINFFFTPVEADYIRQYPIEPILFKDVEIVSDFWKTRLDAHYQTTIAHVLDRCEQTGRLKNFRIAAGMEEGKFEGSFFNDSDVYKILEGMAYSLRGPLSKEHRAFLEEFIEILGKAQMDDGYLYTFYQVRKEMERQWKDIDNMHELYCAGHMIEAGVAHYQATGRRDLLDLVIRFADKINQTFGPGRHNDPPGHQEIELALVKLYLVTGNENYLNLSKFFLAQRGNNGNWYHQDHIPLIKQREAVGHAVRAVYGYAAMADIAALMGDAAYAEAVDCLWDNVVGRKMAVSGGIGGGLWEAFDKEYFLPNRTSYNETCGSIAMVLWNHRMFLRQGDAKYIDVMERALYNGVLTGVCLKGSSFYYPNPLESGGGLRHPWFDCACCPSNIARVIPSVSGFLYAQKGDTLYVNLFASSKMDADMQGMPVRVVQETRYPWAGRIKLRLEPARKAEFTVALRIPGWAQNRPVPSDLYYYLDRSNEPVSVRVNGQDVSVRPVKGFVNIRRDWTAGDTIEMDLPMPVRRLAANERVKDDLGRVALERGPIVYCVEGIDNSGVDNVANILIPDDASLSTDYKGDLLNGVTVISGDVKLVSRPQSSKETIVKPHRLTAVPYYARANRGSMPMAVWVLRDPGRAVLPPLPSIATASTVTSSTGEGNFQALRDQIEPARSADASHGVFNWGGRTGTTEWVQYDFKQPETISSSSVYWYDRFGTIERKPKAWRLLFKEGDNWVPVNNKEPYSVEIDTYNRVTFEPVTTESLRLEADLQNAFLDPYLALPDAQPAKFSASILEWTVE